MSYTYTLVAILAVVPVVLSYSRGAPVEVCEDMAPQHGTTPKTSKFPYTISVNANKIKSGGKAQITIKGPDFVGFLVQVREGDKPVGSFNVPDDDRYTKMISCTGTNNFEPLPVRMLKMFTEFMNNVMKVDFGPVFAVLDPRPKPKVLHNAATHKNSVPKKQLTLEWIAPAGPPGKKYVVYATIAQTAQIYWVRQPTQSITLQ